MNHVLLSKKLHDYLLRIPVDVKLPSEAERSITLCKHANTCFFMVLTVGNDLIYWIYMEKSYFLVLFHFFIKESSIHIFLIYILISSKQKIIIQRHVLKNAGALPRRGHTYLYVSVT